MTSWNNKMQRDPLKRALEDTIKRVSYLEAELLMLKEQFQHLITEKHENVIPSKESKEIPLVTEGNKETNEEPIIPVSPPLKQWFNMEEYYFKEQENMIRHM